MVDDDDEISDAPQATPPPASRPTKKSDAEDSSEATMVAPRMRQRTVTVGKGRKEKGRRKKMGGPTRGEMVISPVGLTLLALNMDGMARS
jgi:hypothetical protein